MSASRRRMADSARPSASSPEPVSARLSGRCQLLAAFASPHEPTHVLRRDETFAVFDRYGDVRPGEIDRQGLYHQGTRFLSCLLFEMDGARPLLLDSTVGSDEDRLDVQCTNADDLPGAPGGRPLGTLHLAVSKCLRSGECHQRLWVRNLSAAPAEAMLSLHFEADFADVLELRGPHRCRGRHLPPTSDGRRAVLGYRGADGVTRRTVLEFDPPPRALTGSTALLHVALQPLQAAVLSVTVRCESSPAAATVHSVAARPEPRGGREHGACEIDTSDELSRAWIHRGLADLRMMTSELATGPYPYAGLPSFNTTFGRDGILTALASLWLQPHLARGVLAYLAANQATEVVVEQDAEPGKILHETRTGELAAIGATPYGRYYGSVDATPLFVLLAGAYYARTADRPFVESLWAKIEAALSWIDDYGDRDGDGFVEYHPQAAHGLAHQGWKDSDEAVFHADGTPASGPIALCEVQGYVYAARQAAAALAAALGHPRRAAQLREQAEALRARFERAFWCEDLSTYALALDGQKQPCRVRTSNAGHCLFAGIASPERARRVADTLLGPLSFSGWGVRTLAVSECRYNPLGYHTGAVWPHDNALAAVGLARYGLSEGALRICGALFDAGTHFERRRMPELFCGFPREVGCGPITHPVACAPQAWSAASILFLLQACLGLEIDGPAARVSFVRPRMPHWLGDLRISNLRVAGATVDLMLVRQADEVAVNVLRREGAVQVVVE